MVILGRTERRRQRGLSRCPQAGVSIVALLSLTALLAVVVSPAQAATTHKLTGSFNAGGTLSEPGPAAVDASGNVYVVTGGSGSAGERVQKFDAAGSATNFSFLGTSSLESPCFFPCITGVTVDNSPGVDRGTIYVSTSNNVLYVYRATGQFAAAFEWSHVRRDNPGGSDGSPCGAAVDGSGNLYLEHPYGFFEDGAYTDKFQPGRWRIKANPPQNWPVAGIYQQPEDGGICKLGADANQYLYTALGGYQESGTLKRWPMSAVNLVSPPSQVIDQGVKAFSADQGSGDVYSDRGTEVTRFDDEGKPVEVFGDGDLSNSYGIAVNSADGTVYVSDGGANDVKIYSAVTTPDVTGVGATTGQHDATISAHVDPAGAGNITGCEVEYGSDTTYGTKAPCSGSLPIVSGTDLTASLSGLPVESEFHYRLRATNANGTTRTIDRTFMTHAVSGIQALPPTNITRTSATLNGSFTGNGEPTSYHFEWGTDTSYGNSTPESAPSSAAGTVPASADLDGLDVYLESSPSYHFRLVATNGAGTTYGPDLTFHTLPPDLPAIAGESSSQVTSTAATLGAEVDPGLGDTTYLFEYGPSSSYGQATVPGPSIGNDDTPHAVSNSISGLVPGTTYHYRAVATNFGGTSYGPDQTFNTPDVPGIVELAAADVGKSGATLRASVRPAFLATAYHFEYGTGTVYGATTSLRTLGADNLEHPIADTVGGLLPATTYHFRAVATNALGTTVSADGSFTTQAAAARLPGGSGQPVKCKRGFVKRHGKCVKKTSKKHRHHKQGGGR